MVDIPMKFYLHTESSIILIAKTIRFRISIAKTIRFRISHESGKNINWKFFPYSSLYEFSRSLDPPQVRHRPADLILRGGVGTPERLSIKIHCLSADMH